MNGAPGAKEGTEAGPGAPGAPASFATLLAPTPSAGADSWPATSSSSSSSSTGADEAPSELPDAFCVYQAGGA